MSKFQLTQMKQVTKELIDWQNYKSDVFKMMIVMNVFLEFNECMIHRIHFRIHRTDI